MTTYKGALVLCLAGLGAASVISAPHVDEWCDPVDPSTTKDCTFFDTAGDESYTCKFFEDTWNLSHEEFVEWVRSSFLSPLRPTQEVPRREGQALTFSLSLVQNLEPECQERLLRHQSRQRLLRQRTSRQWRVRSL